MSHSHRSVNPLPTPQSVAVEPITNPNDVALPGSTRIFVLPTADGERSNTAMLLDGEKVGALIVMGGAGTHSTCDPMLFDYIIKGLSRRDRALIDGVKV